MARFVGSLTINKEQCKGCSLCVAVCPLGILAHADDFNRKGYYPVRLTDAGACTGCGTCALMCPDVCIRVEKRPADKAEKK